MADHLSLHHGGHHLLHGHHGWLMAGALLPGNVQEIHQGLPVLRLTAGPADYVGEDHQVPEFLADDPRYYLTVDIKL